MNTTFVRSVLRTASILNSFVSALAPRLSSAASTVGRLGFGRQAGLVAARRRFPARAHTPLRRGASLIVGALLIGVGVSLLRQADLGLSPYDVLVSGLQPRLGLSFGQTVWLLSGVLFAVAALLREFPSIWGVAYVFSAGFAIDTVGGFINAPSTLFGRGLFVAMALATVGGGIALVVHSGSTGGSFELLMRAGEKRGLDRQKARTTLEVSALVVGIALGGSIGPATVVVALTMGPILVLFGRALEDHSAGRILRQITADPEQSHPSAIAARIQ